MPSSTPTRLEPRKSPVQARSAASVEAILDATLQVLIRDGKEKLTTTRVADRAGVGVGTLYQYFPNKSSLLQATLRRHLEGTRDAVRACSAQLKGKPVAEMCSVAAQAFLEAKLREPLGSAALYAVSADVDGAAIAREMGDSSRAEFAALLRTAPEGVRDPDLISSVVLSAIAGVCRRVVESSDPVDACSRHAPELEALVRGYAATASAPRR